VTEGSRLQKVAEDMMAGQPPITEWVQFLWRSGPPPPRGEQTLAVVTTGRAAFVWREIESRTVARPPAVIG